MTKHKKNIFAFCLIIVSILAIAQEATVDNQLWINYALKFKTGKKFSYGGDVGIRGLLSNYDWNQILVRPAISYKVNKTFSAALAMAGFTTFNRFTTNLNEFRIHQDVNVEWPQTKWFSIFWRGRLEQRWFFYEDPEIDNEFRLRGRVLVGAQSDDFHFFHSKRAIYFQLIYEGFQTIGESSSLEFLINQGRLHFAYGHRIADHWKYEFHFIIQASRIYDDGGLQATQQIFRLRLFHTIPYKKAPKVIPKDTEDRVEDFN